MKHSPVEVKDGKIFWHTAYKPREQAEFLRDVFRSIPKTDWFYPHAQEFAEELDKALEMTRER